MFAAMQHRPAHPTPIATRHRHLPPIRTALTEA
jgi:hypothetical protein